MSTANFDPVALLRELVGRGVRFVVIGGIAGALHGSPAITYDLDVCYSREQVNLERLAEALSALRARLRGAPADVVFLLDARKLRMGDSFTFTTKAGDLDCLGTPAGTTGFDELNANSVAMEVDGMRIRVVSLSDLIRMKQATGRAKDLLAVETLGALLEEIEKRS